MKLLNMPLSRALTIFFLVTILVSAVVIFSSLKIIKDISVSQLAMNEATKLSELIFQNLYNSMKRGWTKDEINEIVSNMEVAIKDVDISLYRSDEVKALYGNVIDHQHPPMIDFDVQDVFDTAEPKLVDKGKQLRFVFPVLTTQDCLGCHSNSKVGQVNGIVNISMPTEKLKLPFEYTITYVVYLFMILIIVLGVLVFLGLRFFLIKPIEQLSSTMREVEETHNYTRIMPGELNAFAEIKCLFETFENMMQKLDAVQAELRHYSEKDVLTGLHNRRKFDELAHRELNRSQHHDHRFAFMVLDLNKFKPINDRYGHDAGDEILIKVSSTLSEFLREEDILARVGGDEFVIVLPETGLSDARMLADRLQSLIKNAIVERKGKVLSVGCSIGISIYPDDGADLKALFNVADDRMYAHKKADR